VRAVLLGFLSRELGFAFDGPNLVRGARVHRSA